MAKRGAAVLEMPEPEYAPDGAYPVHGASKFPGRAVGRPPHDPVEDFAGGSEVPRRRASGVAGKSSGDKSVGMKLRLVGRLPQSLAGLVGTGLALLGVLAAALWLLMVARTFLLHDARFAIRSAKSVEVEGNRHLTQTQLRSVFSEDVERNLFEVSLDRRQAELEALPWVKSATVMRLLPDRLRVTVRERVPVAFVRQGGHVGLVDADGALMEMPTGARPAVAAEHYSFPVVTGIGVEDPASTRAARMRLFARFTEDLDAGGTKNTKSLSEVDLSNPEDVRALVEARGATVLVHFGEDQFRERYDRMMALLPQWRAQYPNLAAADMRYEHEIPLTMAKAVAVVPVLNPVASTIPVKSAAVAKPVIHPVAAPANVPGVSSAVPVKMPVVPVRSFVPAPVVQPWQPLTTAPVTSVSAAARLGFGVKVPVVPKAAVAVPVKLPLKVPAASGAAKPMVPVVAPKKASGGKPAAGKPMVPADTSTQAVQR